MPHSRAYRSAVHYLQHKLSAQQAISRAARCLKDAHEGITGCDPSVGLLEAVRADIEVALREARGMANMDDAAVTGEPAAVRDGEAAA